MNLALSFYDLPKVEQEVTELYAHGLTKKEIAVIRNRSIHTVGNQLKVIFSKTGTRKNTELSAWYFCTRYHLSFNLPELARRFIAGCLLVIVCSSILDEVNIIRTTRSARGQNSRVRTMRRGRNEIYFYYE